MPQPSFTRRDIATLLACLAFTTYGILNLACGTSNSQVAEEEAANNAGNNGGGAQGGGGDPANPDDITFISDLGSVEMTLPMAQFYRDVGGRSQATEAVLSGDWFVDNFSFASGSLNVANAFYNREHVLLSLSHRRHDAELVAWFEEEPPALADRFLDTRADDIVARLGDARALLDLVPFSSKPTTPQSAPEIDALFLDTGALSYYDGVVVELQRTHPVHHPTTHPAPPHPPVHRLRKEHPRRLRPRQPQRRLRDPALRRRHHRRRRRPPRLTRTPRRQPQPRSRRRWRRLRTTLVQHRRQWHRRHPDR